MEVRKSLDLMALQQGYTVTKKLLPNGHVETTYEKENDNED